jgi:PAS domain-containing protein
MPPGPPFGPDSITHQAFHSGIVVQDRREPPSNITMRDDHRPKQELIHEVAGLRKQVVDLKDAMTARRRVEYALREAEALLHALIDGAPVGLVLFRRDGTLLTANRPFAHLLGYDSPAELQRVGGALGVFASPEEQGRVLGPGSRADPPSNAVFRHKSGGSSGLGVMASSCPDQDSLVLVVFDRPQVTESGRTPGIRVGASTVAPGTPRS